MRYIFRSLEIDEDSFAVRDGGAPVSVEPRVLDFLLYLIRHRQRMVSKSELLEHIWHGLAVGDAVITRCASKARQIVRDSNAIRTVYARGYQWVAPIEPHERSTEPSGPSRGKPPVAFH